MLQINGGAVSPDVIAVILGDRMESAQDHIAALGLTLVPQDEVFA
jgi:ABC-type enterochelin transport system permease subunit